MAEDKTTLVDAQAQFEGKLSGKDAAVHGRVRGEIALTGRLLIGEEGRVHASVAADSVEIAGRARGRRARPGGDAARDGARQGPRGRAGPGGSRRRLALRPGRLRSGARARGDRARGPRSRAWATGDARGVKLSELAAKLGCELRGDGEVEIRGVAGLDEAGPGDLSFLANPRYAEKLALTRAGGVVVAAGDATTRPALVSDNPYLAFSRAVALVRPLKHPAPGVHPSAQVDATAVVGEGVHVGALAVVGAGVHLGARSVLHPHVVLYDGVVIGEDCELHSGVHVREHCRLGSRVLVQNGAVIGADGFGFARDAQGRYHKFPQVGIVVIEDDVEIGALTAIDRAALGETRIGRGTKLDNLVQVGHSVTIGEDTVLAGQVGIAGSTRIGRRVTLAGQVGVAGHLEIGDGVVATAQTGIPSSVEPGTVVSGYPAIENRAWLKSSAVFAKLPELLRRLRELERKVESLLSRDGSSS